MPVCSVITCKYSQEKYDPAAERIAFHQFPDNAEVRAKWVEATGLDEWVPTSNDYICSRHFRDSDYFIKRSGKRYLKTAAIPCEYVVYRHLFPDEEVAEGKTEADEDDLEEASAHQEQVPKVVVIHEPEQYVVKVPDQPGPNFDNMQSAATWEPGPNRYGGQMAALEPGWFEPDGLKLVDPDEPSSSRYDIKMMDQMAPGTSRIHSNPQVPDSTIATIYDNQNMRDWDRYRPDRYFSLRPPASLFEDNSEDVDSSGFDENYGRDEEASMNPYPPENLDLRPHLQQLPPPRTPEPVVPQLDAQRILLMDIPAPLPIVEILSGQQKLRDIRKIISRRRSSKKADAAALAEVIEAQRVKFEMQTREMSDRERATAIINLQTKHIVKLNIKHKRQKKIIKRISGVLRRAE